MTAIFSPCGTFRYQLERRVSLIRRTMTVVMLNPSTANADENDPTIRKLLGFCNRLDFGRLIVVNLAALVSTDPKGLVSARDPVGPENSRYIATAAAEANLRVVAWGAGVKHLGKRGPDRVARTLELLRFGEGAPDGDGREVWCWGCTKDGYPRHPLYLPYDAKLELYQ